MTIVRVGTNQKYAEGWESVFKGKKSSKSAPTAKKAAKKSAVKPSPKKKTAKKKAAKKR